MLEAATLDDDSALQGTSGTAHELSDFCEERNMRGFYEWNATSASVEEIELENTAISALKGAPSTGQRALLVVQWPEK